MAVSPNRTPAIRWRGPPAPEAGGRWPRDPETWRFAASYGAFLALFNLLWEVAQLPLFTLWTAATPGFIAYAVLHCTAGDVLIGGSAFIVALVVTRAGHFCAWRWPRLGAVAIGCGLAYTAFSEWLNTVVRASWAYSQSMPMLPGGMIGLAPMLQWIFVPAIALYLARRRRPAANAKPQRQAPSGSRRRTD